MTLGPLLEDIKAGDTEALDYRIEDLQPWQERLTLHRLRRDESRDEKWKYIKMNPVRAGLIKNAEDWPYVYESPRTR